MTEATLNDVLVVIGQIKTEMGQIKTEVGQVRNEMATKVDVARVEGKADAYRTETRRDIELLTTKVDAHIRETRAHRADTDALREDVKAHRAETTAHRAETTAHRAETTAHRAETTAHRAETKKAFDDLDKELSGHAEQHRRLEEDIEALKRRPTPRPARRR